MISKKKEKQLYLSIANDITDARIAIAKLIQEKKVGDKIDNILFKLNLDCPQKAIDLFKPKTI